MIACADLISHKPWAFDGVLTIRLGWLAEAVDLMIRYGSTAQYTSTRRNSVAPTSVPQTPIPLITTDANPFGSIAKRNVYDLSPTTIKEVVSALLTKANWHLLYVIVALCIIFSIFFQIATSDSSIEWCTESCTNKSLRSCMEDIGTMQGWYCHC